MQPRPMSSGKPGMLDPAISTSEAPFSCIADETALVTSMKGDGRADVRKWVVDGLVTLCIPLHSKMARITS